MYTYEFQPGQVPLIADVLIKIDQLTKATEQASNPMDLAATLGLLGVVASVAVDALHKGTVITGKVK